MKRRCSKSRITVRVLLAQVLLMISLTAEPLVAAEAPGTIVIPPNESAQVPSLHRVSVSSGGVAYTIATVDRSGSAFRAVEYGAEAITLDGSPPRCSSVSIDRALAVGDAIAVPITSDDVNCPVTSVEIRGFDDALRSTAQVAAGEAYIGFTGEAIVVLEGPSGVDDEYDIVLREPGSPDDVLITLPSGDLRGALFDADGGFFQWRDGATSTRTLYRLTLPAGTVETVNGGPPNSGAPAFLTATRVGWLMASPLNVGNVAWQPRPGGASTQVSVGSDTEHFNSATISGSTLAWVASTETTYELHLRPDDGTGVDMALGLALTDPWVSSDPNGGFVVLGSLPGAGRGIFHVSEDGSDMSMIQAIEPFWARVERIRLSAGRLVVADDASFPHALWSSRITQEPGGLQAGPMTMLGDDVEIDSSSSDVLASGPRTAYIQETGSGHEAVVLRGSVPERTIDIGDDSYLAGLSGNHLLIGEVGAPSEVVNVVTGSSRVVPATAAMWGRWVIYTEDLVGAGTRLVKVDIDAPASTPPTPITDWESGFRRVIAWWGPWVLSTRAGINELLDVRTGATFGVPWDNEVGVGDGFIAALDYDGIANDDVVVVDLTDASHPQTTLGTVVATLPVQPWGFDTAGGQLLSWRAGDDLVHVAPIGIEASKPRSLDAVTPRRFSPNGDGYRDVWTPSFDYSKPVTWTLKIMDPRGVTERVLSGTARLGWIQARWRGLADSGKRVPAGFHRWSLHVSGLDGIGVANTSGTVSVGR